MPNRLFALFLTYSRSAVFGVALGTIVWFGWAFFHRTFHLYRSLAKIVALCFAICFCLLFDQYIQRGGIVNYNKTVQYSDQVRLDAQSTAIEMIKDYPLSGVGFQQFSSMGEKYGHPIGTHNIYLFLFSEMGLIAFLAFVVFIVIVLKNALKLSFSPQNASLISIFIAFLFIGGCDFYLITFQQGKLMFFISAALIVAMAKQKETLC